MVVFAAQIVLPPGKLRYARIQFTADGRGGTFTYPQACIWWANPQWRA
jgi:hypothetical protein